MKTCPRCGFHNTDAQTRCLKCKALLEHDPYAARHKVRLRLFRFHKIGASLAGFFYSLAYGLRRLFSEPLPDGCPYRYPWFAGFLSLLPGLGQAYNRQYRKAVLHFGVFCIALWFAVATILNPLSYLFIALLVGWILFSFNDAMVTATRIDGQEWTRGDTIASFSALFFYMGVFWSLSQYFLLLLLIGLVLYCFYSLFWPGREVTWRKVLLTAVVFLGLVVFTCIIGRTGNPVIHRWVYWSQDVLAPVLKKGDFIYVDCVTYWFREPRLGELVYYNPRPYRIWKGRNLYLVRLRHAVERVVALPGDRFVHKDGKFYRNGRPVPPAYRPLHPGGLPGYFDFKVPPGRYLVLISYGAEEKMLGGLLGTRRAPSPREGASPDWGEACLVSKDQILGRCLFIWHPVSRRRWLTPPKPAAEAR